MKPKIAVFDFASCEGCELQIVNLEEGLLDLLGEVEVVSFREAMKEHSDNYDIAFVEGSCTRESDEARLKGIRKCAKIVVALGACATIGGINCLKNFQPMYKVKEIVYGDDAHRIETYPARPINAVIEVDHTIHGCPIHRDEFLSVTKALLLGKKPDIPNYPVCVECKLKGNQCVFEKGMFCLGPVTRAGCGAICPSHGHECEGCRGYVDNPNRDSEMEVLEKYGLTVEDALKRLGMFLGYWEAPRYEQ
ncbi:MAG: NADH:ubiquinone oxidoreductase [Planctomycetes bacterium]|nr:NADH:ubiquinone oxidoreductase [Planctomycetota bacterium]